MNNSTRPLTPTRPNFFSPIKTSRKNTTKREISTPNKNEGLINNTVRKLFGGKRKSLKRKNKKTYKAKRR